MPLIRLQLVHQSVEMVYVLELKAVMMHFSLKGVYLARFILIGTVWEEVFLVLIYVNLNVGMES
jgi:hypothetical protein